MRKDYGVTPANQTKERPVRELFPGANRNKSSSESRLFHPPPPLEIHELFVLALFLVWFAGATPDKRRQSAQKRHLSQTPP